MSGEKSTHVSDEKKKLVKELSELAKSKKTILIASIKNIPGSQFQEIVKKIRGKAIVKVPKKSIIFRALDVSGNEAVKELKKQITESVAILFSDIDAFELSAELLSNKSPAKAKAGQMAPTDIGVEAGPTDLVPGPAISELGAVGIPIQIDKGKISIKESKIILKQGETIKAKHADIMNKLGIRPFTIGFVPLAAFDTKENKLYLDLKVDKETTISELKQAFAKSLGFAVEIEHISKDTIGFLIRKVASQEKALEKLAPVAEESVSEEPSSEDVNDKKPEDESDETSDLKVKNSEGGGGVEGGKENTQQEKQNQEEEK